MSSEDLPAAACRIITDRQREEGWTAEALQGDSAAGGAQLQRLGVGGGVVSQIASFMLAACLK